MDYKTMMGYPKKKKLIKEKIEPKKESVVDGIKKELKEWNDESFKKIPKRWSKKAYDKSGLTDFEKEKINEVGIAPELKMYTHAINKNYDRYWDSVKELQKYLVKKGAKKVSKEMGSIYVGNVGKFQNWLKTKFIRMVRKLI